MEILRFEDSTSPAPKRKKSSKGYITLGFVAAVFGIGSAFATTSVQINGGQGISLGQGVTLATACDTEIFISPSTEMVVVDDTTPTFFLSSLAITGVDSNVKSVASGGLGCGTMIFDIQIFDGEQEPYTCTELKANVTAPEMVYSWGSNEITCADDKLSFDVKIEPPTGGLNSSYTINFDEAPSGISYITLVSRES
jgi:hypothetical protein